MDEWNELPLVDGDYVERAALSNNARGDGPGATDTDGGDDMAEDRDDLMARHEAAVDAILEHSEDTSSLWRETREVDASEEMDRT